ncbi:MAG: HlyD family secretion protein [Tsuneonella sp.]
MASHVDDRASAQTAEARDTDWEQGAQTSDGSDSGDDETRGAAASDDDTPPLYKRPGFLIATALVVAVIVIGSVLYWLHARQYESTDDAFIDAHVVRIAPQVAGTLKQVLDADNRHVAAGTLLAVIEPNGTKAQLGETQANAQQAQAQLDQARAQVAASIAQRDQAAAQARVPAADAAKAQRDLARYEQLRRLDPAAVAGQQLDQARAAARSTAAQAAAARQNVDAAAAQIAIAQKQIGAAQAVLAARRAQIEQARVTVGNPELRAPVAGQVVNRSVNVGSYVGPGTPLMAIVPERMWVTANFKETQLAQMRVGQPVTIKVDAFPDVEFQGRVDSIQHGAGQAFSILPPQNATGNYVKVVQRVPVRIEFDLKHGPDPRKYPIGPGMSAVPTVKVR